MTNPGKNIVRHLIVSNIKEVMKDLFEELFIQFEEYDKQRKAEEKQWALDNPVQAACDHGLSFDKEAAQKLLDETPQDPDTDPEIAFIMGSPAHAEIRKRWPRLSGECPKGCEYSGIAYCSTEHFSYGDW